MTMTKQNKITNAFNKAINTKVINKLDIKTLRKLDKILSKIKWLLLLSGVALQPFYISFLKTLSTTIKHEPIWRSTADCKRGIRGR